MPTTLKGAQTPYNFSINQGATFLEIWQWLYSNGGVVAVENYEFKLMIKEKVTDTTALHTASSIGDNPEISLDSDTGYIQIVIEPAYTVDFNFDTAVFDLFAKETADPTNIIRVAYGVISLNKQVTTGLDEESSDVAFGQEVVVAGEDLSGEQPVYLYNDAGTRKAKKAKADAAGTVDAVAFTVGAAASGADVTVKSIGFSSPSGAAFSSPYGMPVYLSAATAGEVSTSPPAAGNYLKLVGLTRSATSMLIKFGETQELL